MQLALNDGTLSVATGPIATELSPELGLEPDALGFGLFLRARAVQTSSRILFRLGRLALLERFVALHRYEPYWMRPAVGTQLREVPAETQSLLARRSDGLYVLLIPLLGDLFRFSLRGGPSDELTLLAETGDAFTAGEGGLAVFVAVGDDPYELLRSGARSVAARLGSRLRVEKPVPDFIDGFGWCTWDAFYQEVSADRVLEGLGRFRDAGLALRFMILDDGWQSVARRPTGEQRLTAFAANDKFPGGLAPLVRTAKRDFGLSHFLVWHAVVGYWGGVDGEALSAYEVRDHARHFGEGILSHMPTFNNDWWGALFGLVPAAHVARFYDDYHATLEAAGVDGIKVDSQAVLEALAQGEGGRVPLSRAYRAALEDSAQRHFSGRLINCMSNAQETWYFSPDSTLLRSSIDFFPTRPEWQGLHLFTNAQVGLWFGEFMLPDWDMFQSDHPWGAYHAAGRALSGGPIYVSDKPGQHDLPLLRRLVCSDGSVLRCDEPGRPTLDIMFHDPTRESVPMKIFSRNGASGFVGAFNGHFSGEGKPVPVVSARLGPGDVPGLRGRRFACYFHVAGQLEVLEPHAFREFSLGERAFELATIVPVDDDDFAAVGLIEKFNSAGAIRWLAAPTGERRYGLRDGGTFLAHSGRAPRSVQVDGVEVPFEHDAARATLRAKVVRAGELRIQW